MPANPPSFLTRALAKLKPPLEEHGKPALSIRPDVLGMLAPDARFITGFMRSGSRWLQVLAADIAYSVQGGEPRLIYDLLIKRELERASLDPAELELKSGLYIPCLHVRKPAVCPAALGLRPPIYRSHTLIELLGRAGAKFAFIFRRPSSMLVSFEAYSVRRGILKRGAKPGRFRRSTLAKWRNEMRAALDLHGREPDRILFLEYGDSEPISLRQTAALAAFFHLTSDPAIIEGAASRLHQALATINRKKKGGHERGTNRNMRLIQRLLLARYRYPQLDELYDQASVIAAGDLETFGSILARRGQARLAFD